MRFRFCVTMLEEADSRQVVEGVRHIGVLWPKNFLPDVEGAQKQRFCLIVFLLIKVQASQVVGQGGDVGMVLSKSSFLNGHRAPIEWLACEVTLLILVLGTHM